MKNNANPSAALQTASSRSRVSKAYHPAASTPPESQEALLQLYLPIVKSIVAKIKINLPPHIEEDDLYSVGLAGLISALKKYDPSQQKSFGSYAAMRIRGAILDELRRMDWMPRNARSNFKRLRKTVEALEQRLGLLLLACGPDAAVVEPAALVRTVRSVASELLAHHRGE